MNDIGSLKDLSRLELIKIRKAELSLYEFVKQAWPIIEPDRKYVDGKHIQVLCEHLECVSKGQINDLLINMPPRHMKSLCVSVFWPAWVWITQPSSQWIVATSNADLTKRDNLKNRNIIESEWYQERWGDIVELSDEQSQKNEFMTTKKGRRLGVCLGGKPTGRDADYLVADDLNDINEIRSPTVRENVIHLWTKVLSTRRNDKQGDIISKRVVMQQRCHLSDLAGHILEHLHETNYEVLNMEAIATSTHVVPYPISKKEWIREEKTALYPERFDLPALEQTRLELTDKDFEAQFQQKPAPDGGNVWKPSWFQNWEGDYPTTILSIVQSWDTAFKDNAKSDYSCCTTWGILTHGYVLLDVFREKLQFPELKEAVKSLKLKHNPIYILIEDKASGQSIYQACKDMRVPLIPITPVKDKIRRAELVSPILKQKKVWYYTGDWYAEFIKEVIHFPDVDHDDQIDSCSQLLNYEGNNSGPQIR